MTGTMCCCRLLAFLFLCASLSTFAMAQTGCDAAIAQFRRVIDSDAQSGNVHKSVYNRILPELGRIAENCRAGRDAEASRALQALKRRHGYH
jgi:hypothetical protein